MECNIILPCNHSCAKVNKGITGYHSQTTKFTVVLIYRGEWSHHSLQINSGMWHKGGQGAAPRVPMVKIIASFMRVIKYWLIVIKAIMWGTITGSWWQIVSRVWEVTIHCLKENILHLSFSFEAVSLMCGCEHTLALTILPKHT